MILNLILYNNQHYYNKMMNSLRQYLKKKKVLYFFYCYKNIKDDYIIDGDIIYINGKESYKPGIITKTLIAFNIIKNYDFEYVVRTNISTVVNIDLLKDYLIKNKIDYGGINMYLYSKNEINIDINADNLNYVSGTCIILKKNILNLIVDNIQQINKKFIDDVAIGFFLLNNNIKLTKITNYVFNGNYNKDIIIYRNRTINRKDDCIRIQNIINELLKI